MFAALAELSGTPGRQQQPDYLRWRRLVVVVALALIISLWLATLPAGAQSNLAIKLDPAGTCPDLKVLRGPETTVGEVMRSQFQISRPSVPLYQGPDLFDKVSSEPLAFGEKIVVYVRGRGQPAPYLVYVSKTGKCGWLRDDDVWSVSDPLRLTQIPGFEKVVGSDRKQSNLLAKVVAMAVNVEGKLFQVPVYSKPFDPATTSQYEEKELRVGTVNYFAILNVYQHQSAMGGKDCRDVASPECFILVGGLTDAKGDVAPVPQIHGWVQGKNVALWPSALSLYYMVGSSGVKIYRNELAAQSVILGKPPAEQEVLAYKEDRHAEPTGQNIPRFPVIDGKLIRDQQIFTVVFAGEACALNDPICMTAATSGVLKGDGGQKPALRDAKISRQLEGIKGIDVLLVIDGSESMDKYYEHVIQAVEEAASLAKAQNQRIRFAAATYGDYLGDVADKQRLAFKWVARFGADGSTNQIHNLGRGLVGEDPHYDPPEAPFAAIIRAVEEATWSPDNLIKLVVWIGDAGNRPIGQHSTPRGRITSIEERFSEEDVVAALKVDRVKAAFAAVQVRGSNNQEQLRLFERNANRIRQLLGTDRGKGALEVIRADTSERATPGEIVASIRSKLLEILHTSAIGEDYIQSAASGRETRIDLKLPAARLAMHYIEEELKLNKDEIRKRAGEVQAILHGYVVQNDRKPDFAYWLALRQEEFVRLQRQMNELCDALGTSQLSRDDIAETMTAVVRAVTYEDPNPGEQLGAYFKRLLGVPKASLSEIMGYTIVGFADWFVRADAAAQGKYRAQICTKQKMLELMASNRRVKLSEIEWRDGRPSVVRAAKQEQFHWDWSIGSGIKYYFIPLELLP